MALIPIKNFRGIHKEEPVVILANGPSLLENIETLEGWHEGGGRLIGMNASLEFVPSNYYIALDGSTAVHSTHHKFKPYYMFSMWRHPIPYKCNEVIIPQAAPQEDGTIRNVKDHEEYKKYSNYPGWSNDLQKGIFSCRTSVWYTLQLAHWMAFDPIYIVGWDLGGPRPDGHIHEGKPIPNDVCKGQYKLMDLLKKVRLDGKLHSRVYNCSPYNKSDSIPKRELPPWEVAKKSYRRIT